MRRIILLFISMAFVTGIGEAENLKFQVRHKHEIGGCQGTLVFGETTAAFETDNKKHSRVWKYEDIQQIGLLNSKKLVILTYEDRKIILGQGLAFNFDLQNGEISEALWTFLDKHMTKPLVSSFIPAGIAAKYSLPVKRLKGWGGSQGTLEISEGYVIYRSSTTPDSRIWRYENIGSIGSTGPYDLRITTMERVHGEHGSLMDFIFDLKERLNEAAYDFIWWKLNGPRITAMRQ